MSKQTNPEHDGRYGWYVLIVLSLVNMMNYMDRMLLSVLLPEIRRDIALNDTQLGLLTGFAFSIFYASFGLPLARLADVWVRRNIIGIALIFWSLMTAAAGAAQTFSHLLLARIGLAIGEAGCIPPSHSLISDYVPAERRPSAFAIYTAGATAGIIAGLALGGVLSSLIGWRLTFIVLGMPGVLLGLLILFTVREPPHGRLDDDNAPKDAPPLRRSLAFFRSQQSFRCLVGYFAVVTLSASGFSQWMPSFYSRSFEMSQGQIGVFFGFVFGAGSAVGTIAGGFIGERLMKSNRLHGVSLCMATVLLAFPLWVGVFLSQIAWLSLVFNFAAATIVMAPNGVAFAMVQAVTPSRLRALAIAIVMFAASLIGMGAGPVLIGTISDFLAEAHGVESLRYALLSSTFLTLLALPFLIALRGALLKDINAAQQATFD